MYNTIDSVLESGLALGKIKVLLEALFGLDKDAIEEAIEDAGIKAKRSNGFAADYYEFLAESTRTKEEATAFINGTGAYESTSNNVKKHLNHYLAIFELTLAVRENFASKLGE